jgi:hypothetical protein
MYQIARKRMTWHPPIRVHPIPDSSSFESKLEPEPGRKRTARMRVNPDFKFSLFKSDSKSGQEVEPQHEPVWDSGTGPEHYWSKLENSDEDRDPKKLEENSEDTVKEASNS